LESNRERKERKKERDDKGEKWRNGGLEGLV
jgi:hypothetical protein